MRIFPVLILIMQLNSIFIAIPAWAVLIKSSETFHTSDGTRYSIEADHAVYSKKPSEDRWYQVAPAFIAQIYVTNDHTIYGMGAEHAIYRTHPYDYLKSGSDAWVRVTDGDMKAFSVLQDNTIIGVGSGNLSDKLYFAQPGSTIWKELSFPSNQAMHLNNSDTIQNVLDFQTAYNRIKSGIDIGKRYEILREGNTELALSYDYQQIFSRKNNTDNWNIINGELPLYRNIQTWGLKIFGINKQTQNLDVFIEKLSDWIRIDSFCIHPNSEILDYFITSDNFLYFSEKLSIQGMLRMQEKIYKADLGPMLNSWDAKSLMPEEVAMVNSEYFEEMKNTGRNDKIVEGLNQMQILSLINRFYRANEYYEQIEYDVFEAQKQMAVYYLSQPSPLTYFLLELAPTGISNENGLQRIRKLAVRIVRDYPEYKETRNRVHMYPTMREYVETKNFINLLIDNKKQASGGNKNVIKMLREMLELIDELYGRKKLEGLFSESTDSVYKIAQIQKTAFSAFHTASRLKEVSLNYNMMKSEGVMYLQSLKQSMQEMKQYFWSIPENKFLAIDIVHLASAYLEFFNFNGFFTPVEYDSAVSLLEIEGTKLVPNTGTLIGFLDKYLQKYISKISVLLHDSENPNFSEEKRKEIKTMYDDLLRASLIADWERLLRIAENVKKP